LKAFKCPTDPRYGTGLLDPGNPWALGNYAPNFAVFGIQGTSSYYGNSRIPATFADGTSNTMIMAEKAALCQGFGSLWAHGSWNPPYMTMYYSPMTSNGPGSKFQENPTPANCNVLVAQSYHTGGMNTLLGDGSVRFLTSQISPITWQFVNEPADGNVLPSDW